VCSYYQPFDHDANVGPYYDVFDECNAKLNAMIETLNERHTHFVSKMREYGLMHEIDPSLPSLRFKASLYDDCDLYLPLTADSTVSTPLIDLKEVFDPPLTSLPFVTPCFLAHLAHYRWWLELTCSSLLLS